MAENLLGRRTHDDDDASLRPLRKIRAISGYNLWHAEFMKTTGMYFYVLTTYLLIRAVTYQGCVISK